MNAPAPELRLGRRAYSAFQLWGIAGYGAAFALTLLLAAHSGLSLSLAALLALLTIPTFLALALITKAIVGVECLIYYHYEIAILCVSAAVVRGFDQPVLAYLDVSAAALGCFLAFGRLGCAAVGCCHGRPASSGLVYDLRHVETGFPSELMGVRLLPVQWLEAGGAALLSASVATLVWHDVEPGSGVLAYSGGYALLRFGLEFLRGDSGRGAWLGVSTAQWTSALIWSFSCIRWPWLAPLLPLGVLARIAFRWRRPWLAWFDARHVNELAAFVTAPCADSAPIVRATSVGLRCSAGRLDRASRSADLITLSLPGTAISPALARRLALVLARLRRSRSFDGAVLQGQQGVIHLVFQDSHRGCQND